MKYVYWGLIALAALAVIFGIIRLLIYLRRKRAAERVRRECREEKIRRLDGALAGFGFAYGRGQDCIVAGRNPWQRQMGYCRQYDEAAPAMNIIVEYEPVYFRYGGRNWLLEFWKGQYDCATGAEIGLYYNEGLETENPERLFYTCASDDDRLQMQFILKKEGRTLLERRGLHWWLTGFLPGEYSTPSQLVMNNCVAFPDVGMRNAFCRGLLKAGYRAEEIRLGGRSVSFVFDRPKTTQRSRYGRWYRALKSVRNRRFCRRFLRLSRPFVTVLDRISFLGFCFPLLYRSLAGLGLRSSSRRLSRYRRRK